MTPPARLLSVILLALALPASPLHAQAGRPVASSQSAAEDVVSLVADRVELTGETLIASGAVEVFRGTERLKASRITYDNATGGLAIEGPITLIGGDGRTVIYAEAAELSDDMRAGILRSARLVLDQQMQIAAAQVERIEGRYTRMADTVASSCTVCAANPTPLWQIRAKEIVHDAEAQQVYFHNARFEVMGIPVVWLPYMRLPDPSLDRATGFLTPEFRSTDALGFGVKLPYFIRIGDHADLTLTPYLSTGNTRTLEFRYRQAYRSGRIEINGATSSDDILPGEQRGYAFVAGQFALPRGYQLSFDLETTSDAGYLLDYDYSDKDRLDSAVTVSRYTRRGYSFANLTYYDSLRATENNQTQPATIGYAGLERRFFPAGLGGIATARLDLHGHERRSAVTTDDNGDGIADGRDVARLSASANWRRDWIVGPGFLVGAETALAWTHTVVSQDALEAGSDSYLWGAAAVDLRWPMVRRGPEGRTTLEPFVQLVWSDDRQTGTSLDQSSLPELDEGNLLSLDRFAGTDAFEVGNRVNLGFRYSHRTPDNWQLDLLVGRIFRQDDLGQFATSQHLSGKQSDWVTVIGLRLPNRLQVANRALFDDALQFSRNELRVDWWRDRFDLSGAYLWMRANPAENRTADTSELTMNANYRINARWDTSLDYRFDFDANRAASATLGIGYNHDCVEVDLSVSRRFTSSTNVRPTTDFGLQVQLKGFGGRTRAGGASACNG